MQPGNHRTTLVTTLESDVSSQLHRSGLDYGRLHSLSRQPEGARRASDATATASADIALPIPA